MVGGRRIAAVAFVAIALHAGALAGRFVWDDEVLLLRNAYLRDLPAAWKLFVPFTRGLTPQDCARPVWILSAAFDVSFWDLNPVGHHVTNLLLLGVASASVLGLAVRLGVRPGPATAAALLYAVHPAVLEPTHVATFREDLAALAAAAVAAMIHLRFRGAAPRRRAAAAGAAALLYYASLLSKEMLVGLPLWLVAADLLREGCGALRRPGAYLALAAVAAVWYAGIHRPRFYYDQSSPGVAPRVFAPRAADRPRLLGTRLARGGATGRAVGATGRVSGTWSHHLLRCAYPVGPTADPQVDPSAPEGLRLPRGIDLAVVAVAMLATALLVRRDPAAGALALWFWIALLPVSNAVPLFNEVADRYRCVPWAGGAGALAAAALGSGARGGRRSRAYALGITALCYAALTLPASRVWTHGRALWTASALETVRTLRVQESLADQYVAAGDPARAMRCSERAMRINPDAASPYLGAAELHRQSGRMDLAEESLNRGLLRLRGDARAFVLLQVAEYRYAQGRYAEASDALRESFACAVRMPMYDRIQILRLLSRTEARRGLAEETAHVDRVLRYAQEMARQGIVPPTDLLTRIE